MSPTPRDLVIHLLKTLHLAETDWDARSGGNGVIRMPSLYRQGSYGELEARLGDMRDNGLRHLWLHVSRRYRYDTWVPRLWIPVQSKRTIKGRMPQLPPRSELAIQGEVIPNTKGLMQVCVYIWGSDTDQKAADEGVEHLTAQMYGGDSTRITLPLPLLYPLLEDKWPHTSSAPRTERSRASGDGSLASTTSLSSA